MHSALRIALVSTLVVLSGCQFGGDRGTTTTREPFDVPETPLPGIDVPGLTTEGVADPEALASAHEAGLRGQNYTLVRKVIHRYANGTLRTRRTVRAEFGRDRESYRYRTTIGGTRPASPRRRVDVWSNESAAARAVMEGNSTTYIPGFGERNFVHQSDRFVVLFGAAETNLTDRTIRNERALYRVESTSVPGPKRVPLISDFVRVGGVVDSVTNVSLVAWIDEQGTVRRYRLTYLATVDGRPVRVTETHRVSGVGATTVGRPAWLPEAFNETGAAIPSG